MLKSSHSIPFDLKPYVDSKSTISYLRKFNYPKDAMLNQKSFSKYWEKLRGHYEIIYIRYRYLLIVFDVKL